VQSQTRNVNYISRSFCPSFQIPMVTSVLNQLNHNRTQCRTLSTIPDEQELIDSVTFERVCEETLDSLSEYIEELVEQASHLQSADVGYSSGVLTMNFGPPYGTYVINKQSPNRQIWLSSPVSGPKRYDYVVNGSSWIYKHDGKSLHQLLQEEIPKIVKSEVDFSKCLHSLIS